VRLTKWTLAPKGIDTFLQTLDIFTFLEKVLQVFRRLKLARDSSASMPRITFVSHCNHGV
jgi:hypothetical protein